MVKLNYLHLCNLTLLICHSRSVFQSPFLNISLSTSFFNLLRACFSTFFSLPGHATLLFLMCRILIAIPPVYIFPFLFGLCLSPLPCFQFLPPPFLFSLPSFLAFLVEPPFTHVYVSSRSEFLSFARLPYLQLLSIPFVSMSPFYLSLRFSPFRSEIQLFTYLWHKFHLLTSIF